MEEDIKDDHREAELNAEIEEIKRLVGRVVDIVTKPK